MRSNYDDLVEGEDTPITEMRARWRAFTVSRLQARHRGEDWQLTYEEWWSLWKPHWHNRGRHAEAIQMSRRRHYLPWKPSNIVMRTKRERYRKIEPRYDTSLDPQGVATSSQ